MLDRTVKVRIVQLISLACNGVYTGMAVMTWITMGVYQALVWIMPLSAMWIMWYIGVERVLRAKKQG